MKYLVKSTKYSRPLAESPLCVDKMIELEDLGGRKIFSRAVLYKCFSVCFFFSGF